MLLFIILLILATILFAKLVSFKPFSVNLKIPKTQFDESLVQLFAEPNTPLTPSISSICLETPLNSLFSHSGLAVGAPVKTNIPIPAWSFGIRLDGKLSNNQTPKTTNNTNTPKTKNLSFKTLSNMFL